MAWISNVESRLKEWQVRRSFVGELDLNASEVEIVLDYFVYGRELFQPDELAFVEGRKHQQTHFIPSFPLPQIFLIPPSWQQCLRTFLGTFPTLSIRKKALQYNFTMVFPELMESMLNFTLLTDTLPHDKLMLGDPEWYLGGIPMCFGAWETITMSRRDWRGSPVTPPRQPSPLPD